MLAAGMSKAANPFRFFNSSPEVIRLRLVIWKCRGGCEFHAGFSATAMMRMVRTKLSGLPAMGVSSRRVELPAFANEGEML